MLVHVCKYVCTCMYVCLCMYVNTYMGMGRGVGGVCIMYINITLFMFNNMRIDCIVLISLYIMLTIIV